MRLRMTGTKAYEEIQRGDKMAGKSKDGGEKESPMMKVATFIVDRRNLFFLLFGIAIIFSVVSMNWVSVENAMSAYLSGQNGGAVHYIRNGAGNGDQYPLRRGGKDSGSAGGA